MPSDPLRIARANFERVGGDSAREYACLETCLHTNTHTHIHTHTHEDGIGEESGREAKKRKEPHKSCRRDQAL